MRVIKTSKQVAPLTARDVPQGAVYTWGTGVAMYMRTSLGAACLNDGRYLSEVVAELCDHFDREVRLVGCELHVQE